MQDVRHRLQSVTQAAYRPSGSPAGQRAESRRREPRGHRWGTPVIVAVRVALAVLLVAVLATITVILTQPNAPAHQPTWADPSPPAGWPAAGEQHTVEPGTDSTDPHTHDGGAHDEAEAAEADDGVSSAGVLVHVAGQVLEPGVVHLPSGSRVHDAVQAAGGPTAQADLDAVNLAASVHDGQQVYLPAIGEEERSPPPDGQSPPGAVVGTERVNVNNADALALQALPGIGPALAERIVSHRREHGPFRQVDDLMAVSGIGPSTMARLRDLVTV